MERNGFWRPMRTLVLLLGIVWSGGAFAASPAGGATDCTSGTWVVKGRSLIRGGLGKGEDAVVIRFPGDVDPTRPELHVRSGCPEAPVTLEPSRGGLRLAARLTGCQGTDGEIGFRAKLDRSCRIMRGQLGEGRTRRRFRAALNGGVAGRVLGKVSVRHGDDTVFLPGVKVFLVKRAGGRIQHPTTTTDETGSFSVSTRVTGEFHVCASGNGFRRFCADEPVRFGSGEPQMVDRNVAMAVDKGAVHGKVLLADGSRCYHPATATDAGVSATLSRAREGGRTANVPANAFADYVLAGLPGPGIYPVQVACGGGTLSTSITVGPEELAGTRAVNLTMPNSAPIITLLAAWQDGAGVRTATPGSTVEVVAEVEDPDGDPLHFAWVDDADAVTSVDAPRLRWTLKSVPAENTVNILVTDGKGGYVDKQLIVRGGVPFTRFTGNVKDPTGTPIANATVRVGDEVTHTDAEGFFRVKAPNAPRHVLTVKAPGHALYSRAFDADAVGVDVVLKPAKRFTADPTTDIVVQEGADGATIRVPAGSLVDAAGNAPAGPVEVLVSTYDPEQEGFPGDGLGETGGEVQGMQLQTCLWMTVTDADGRRYDLAPGARAEISFKIPRSIPDAPPATLALVRFDDTTGRWVEDGVAVLEDDRYVAPVHTLASSGIAFFNGSACLRIEADDNSLEKPFYLKIIDDTFTATVLITQHITPVYGLRPNTFHFLQARPKSNPGRIFATAVPMTGPNLSPSNPPFPYSGCTRVVLKANLPTNHWLYEFGFGSETSAQSYYQSIGAIPAKDTFAKWLTANGFESGFRSNDVVFFNPNEIGLGRRVNCRKRLVGVQTVVACYNTKFGEVGGNVEQMLEETADFVAPGDSVAMEFSPGGLSAARNVKFFIYGPDGKLKTKTAFDKEGYVKYVPGVCLHCHYGPLSTSSPSLNGKFVALDPHEYQYMSSGPYTLDNQQERFRQLNDIISYAVQHTGPPWKLIESIYPPTNGTPGVHVPGTKAIRQPVPDGWRDAPEIWTKIVKPSCRTCHMNFDIPGLTWEKSTDSVGQGAGMMCSTGEMPNAMAPQLRLFRTTDPFLPDVLSSFYNNRECRSYDIAAVRRPPTVTITSPANQTHVPYGGVKGVHFTATASDPDGTPVTIQWLDQAGNTIGFGTAIDKVFPAPGVQKVRAIAHDTSGTPSRAAEVTLNLDNVPPTLAINSPLAIGNFYRFVPYSVRATIFDSNRDLTCDKVVWESDFYPPQTGCEPFPYAFQTLGQHAFTVHVTDPAGARVTQTRTVNVVEAPPHTPPVVAIFTPLSGAVLDPAATTELGATLGDPDIDDCLGSPNGCANFKFPTYQWSVRFGANFEKVLPVIPDANEIFRINPVQMGITGCGPTPLDLVFKATDSDKMTAVAVRRVTLAFPPC